MPSSEEEKLYKILDKAVADVQNALLLSVSMSNVEFEEMVCKALLNATVGTVFHNKIEQTDELAFPDILIGHYGIEVKKTTRKNPIITGNSIFETKRVEGVQDIFVILAYDSKNNPKVVWKPYRDVIVDIAITHSPRYRLDLSASGGNNLFDRIGSSYDEFRKLDQNDKMRRVRNLYRERGNELWWLSEQNPPFYRYFIDLEKEERKSLIGECFLLCPEVFGKGNNKFNRVGVYALSKGILNHNWRDSFTAGGKVAIGGVNFPKIVATAVSHINNISDAILNVEDDLLSEFWEEPPPPCNKRHEAWLYKVKIKYQGVGDICEVLKSS